MKISKNNIIEVALGLIAAALWGYLVNYIVSFGLGFALFGLIPLLPTTIALGLICVTVTFIVAYVGIYALPKKHVAFSYTFFVLATMAILFACYQTLETF